jgi:hypothetical protein
MTPHSPESRRRCQRLLYNSRYRAKKKGLPHELDLDWILTEVGKGKCALTGLPLSLDKPKHALRSPWSPSLDRKDSNLGYTRENTQIVCTAVNTLKSAATLNDLLLLSTALLRKHDLL